MPAGAVPGRVSCRPTSLVLPLESHISFPPGLLLLPQLGKKTGDREQQPRPWEQTPNTDLSRRWPCPADGPTFFCMCPISHPGQRAYSEQGGMPSRCCF